MDDTSQRVVASRLTNEPGLLPTVQAVTANKERTAEQRAQRQALRATKLARKQQQAAAQRQLKAAQAKADQPPEERKESEADEPNECADQLNGSGSAVYGNFHNYYAFNAVSERLQFITHDFIQHVLHRTSPLTLLAPAPPTTSDNVPPHSLLPLCSCPSSDWSLPLIFPRPERADTADRAVYVCDLGCNEGDLTFELVSRLAAASVDRRPVVAVGVDIDGELIRRARHKCTLPGIHDFLRPRAGQPVEQAAATYLSFYQANLICSSTFTSLHSLHPPTRPTISILLPPFHLVTCFSLLMWLHLCYGSTALCHFLSSLCPLASHLLIELQGWRHYRSAIERRRRSGCDDSVWQWAAIEEEWRGRGGQALRERVVSVLQAGGMREVAVLGRTKWGREVIWFSRTDIDPPAQ